MLGWAICCAVLDALFYACAAQLQHKAVAKATGGGALTLRGLGSALTSWIWVAGLALAATGTALHVLGLTMAPLAVIQPFGVLSLVLTVAFAVVSTRAKPGPVLYVAMLMSAGGIFAFVTLSATAAVTAGTATATPAQVVMAIAVGVGALGFLLRDHARCLLLSAATALLFGSASALIRAVSVNSDAHGFGGPELFLTVQVAVAFLLGGWLLHQAFASGPAAIVVATTTVIDPLTAVAIGIGAYGEFSSASVLRLVGAGAAAVVALGGVLLLSRALSDLHASPVTPEPIAVPA